MNTEMLISVLNQKGGVGKTTLAIHLAHGLALKGFPTMLMDADPQGSARDWAASRKSAPLLQVVTCPQPNIHKVAPVLAETVDYLIIDGPPRVSELARSAILAADLVIIPCQPSPLDVWACKEIVDLIQEASVFKETQKSVFVINRKIANTAIGRDVADALAGYGLPVLKSSITQRVVFAEAIASGSTVFEVEPRGQATAEMKSVIEEILTYG